MKTTTGWRHRLSSPHWKLLLFVIGNVFVLNGAMLFFPKVDVSTLPGKVRPSTFLPTALVFRGFQLKDSLGPMLPALHLLERNRAAPVYEAVFFTQHLKFQYPLSSLLPYYCLQRAGVSDRGLYRISKYCVDLSLCLTILITVLIGCRFSRRLQPGGLRWLDAVLIAQSIGIAGLFFAPLTIAAVLGQIQTLLTLGFAVALYCWICGQEAAAGAAIGLMVLVKPQYGLFFLWALLRRKYSAALAGLGCAAAGTLASLLAFGLHNNLEYVAVLRFIGQRGEAYFANQTLNAVLNHLMGNGNLMVFDPNGFAPYNPVVFWGTVLSSLALVLLALLGPWGRERRGGAGDFASVIRIATMASPVAWNHHYGILLPIFALLWFGDGAWRKVGWATVVLGVSYVVTSNVLPPAAFILASTAMLNFFATYVLWAAILTLILLFRSRLPEAIRWKRLGVRRA